ncbi:MAG: phosphoribosyl-AMP cyclohydrolase [Endomicrobium sp.]|jgi:phosphoribosyl-AMP cyclohydrolase|nr:phosphoribosyl-AMP cyclohydrolase [Endomicrobium sp.]
MEEVIKCLKFDDKGLIPVIVQDYSDNIVLMVAYMNKKSVIETLKHKKTFFWSRSRKKFWMKGESSGNVQRVKEFYYDCDSDCILLKVEQIGNAACHTGYRSCFFTKVNLDGANNKEIVGKRIFNPKEVYTTKKTK